MIRNWSIRNRVLLLALLPVICLGVVLSSYFIHSRVRDLKATQAALGRTMADQLASASLYGVLTHNAQALQALAEHSVHEPNVQSVTITDDAVHMVIKASRSMQLGGGFTNALARRIGAKTGFEGALTFTGPILRDSPPGNGVAPPAVVQLGTVTVKLSEVHFAENQAHIIMSGGLILLVCLAFSILLAVAISGSVVAPIDRVIRMVQRFTSGDHATRVPERSGGELGQLEKGINHMAANAERSQQELQDQVDQATAELRGTLEEFEIKSVELDLARKRALEASRVKSEFLANMSHEIRTPMSAVLGFSNLLARTPLNDGQRSYLATLRQSAHTLLALLDNILDASRLEMGASELHPTGFVLRELLEETVQVHAPDAYAKQIELVLDTDGQDTQPLLGDRSKLMRVLANLVNNAIKFTDTGTVAVRCRCTARADGRLQMELEVADTGIGIDAASQRRLFQPFFQAHSSADRRHEGAGLGLYISKRLVNQMGGALSLHSVPGEGSRFRVSLAFAADLKAAPGHAAAPRTRSPRRSVLVYESNPQSAAALQARFERLGWNVALVSELAQIRARSAPPRTVAAIVLALSDDELRDPREVSACLPDSVRRLPRLILVNSVHIEVQADIGRQLAGACLPKSATEAQLGQQLEQILGARIPTLPTPPPAATALLRGHTIAVADDNRINRLLERILLEKYGARVLEARSGKELARLVAQNPVSLILLDMQMPDEDGWQIAAELKAGLAGQPTTPVIALSAMSCDKSAEELQAVGLSGWLMKPLEEAALQEIVTMHLGGAPAETHRQQAAAETLHAAIGRLRPALRQMLREDLLTQQNAMQAAWDQADAAALRQQVHKLNGSAAFCGFTELRNACSQLEEQLRKGDMQATPALMEKVTRQIAEVLAILEHPALSPALPS